MAVVAFAVVAACGNRSTRPDHADRGRHRDARSHGDTRRHGDITGDTAPTIGYFVSGGLKPMGDQVTVSADGTAVLTSYNKEVARCTLVDPQATSIRELTSRPT